MKTPSTCNKTDPLLQCLPINSIFIVRNNSMASE